ncbi:MAG: SOS response-associated peptidase [Bacteroidetes bacterium]|nr:SOS response-associated peptidase [Bacteroidota bacterium]
MCFFFLQSKKAIELENRFNAKIVNKQMFEANINFNGFTHPKTPVIASNNKSLIQHYQWGLIPNWAKDDSIKQYTLNAKIETLNEKPAFKGVVKNRCLIISDGFYEWQWLDPKGKHKQKYLITLPDNELFAFAGLWSEWTDKGSGEIINTYSIVTTEANEQMSVIHNSKKRMPVILNKDNELNWLSNYPFENFKQIDTELIALKE